MVKTIAIIGRPNVGKSTLFNRLIGKNRAIVANNPGVTRDYIIEKYTDRSLNIELIDTAGLEETNKKNLSKILKETSKKVIKKSDAIFFLVDVRSEITSDDLFLAKLVRKSGKKIFLVANKCETVKQDQEALKFDSFGFGESINISAEHNRGIQYLKSLIYESFNYEDVEDESSLLKEDNKIKISILGRPNSGKSTLTNFLLKEDRQLVGETAGLTRDTISEEFQWKKNNYIIIDTPGLRRKSKISDELEKKSSKSSLRSVDTSDISILMIDATIGFDKQDLIISNYMEEKGKPFILAINKWDLIKDKKDSKSKTFDKVSKSLSQFRGASIVFISSKSGHGVEELMKTVLQMHNLSFVEISTHKLNSFLDKVTSTHTHPTDNGREIRFKYITQINSNPIYFAIFTNKPKAVLDSYKRYILNNLREEFSLSGIPIKIVYKKTDNPYKKD
ncbi:MAG: ribosome biogenesis GTPase Der [Alphaproteobacteria bacterium]